ncbi:MAG: lytic transglycosylase domain-containing protein [Deltaproteobacteria bacterium]|jgi:soluble lytic murein transglycosylase-like protein|nr:lytic transglycosylase domain-containing protein [Deltaproteobacteria bacterium]
MTQKVKGNKIAEQFGSFLESRKTAKKAHTSFSDKLLAKLTLKEKKQSVNFANRIKVARRRQPPPKLGMSRRISSKHAKRLAQYAPHIEAAARKYQVPVELICGVILQESGAQKKAVSHCGARGLMQLMPGTAKRFGVRNSFDPGQNIDGGTRYLRFLLNHFKGDISLALAGYNAGEHNVEKYGNKIPPFKETQNYVPAVLNYTQSMIDIFASKNVSQMALNYGRRA